MKALFLAAVAAVALGCSGPPNAPITTSAPTVPAASVPDILNPTTPEAMATLWCPASDLEACRVAVAAAFTKGDPAGICVQITGKPWLIVPLPAGAAAGGDCGDAGALGTLRGIIVKP
jgi:hypothetical protein